MRTATKAVLMVGVGVALALIWTLQDRRAERELDLPIGEAGQSPELSREEDRPSATRQVEVPTSEEVEASARQEVHVPDTNLEAKSKSTLTRALERFPSGSPSDIRNDFLSEDIDGGWAQSAESDIMQ